MTSRFTFDQVDDPTFAGATARIDDDSVFRLDGWVELSGKPGIGRPRRGKHRVMMEVEGARRFAFDDQSGTGVFIPETIDAVSGIVEMTGVIPGTLTIWTVGRSTVTFIADEQPFAVRHRRQWVML